MQLMIRPNGVGDCVNTFLSAFFCIVRGEFDDNLTWPMDRQIVLALIDQTTGNCHTINKYRHCFVERKLKNIFHKPSTRFGDDDKFFLGRRRLINSNALLNNAKICNYGSILIKCLIN